MTAMSAPAQLWVCWWRGGKWVAKHFTGNESWEDLREPGSYNESVVLVAARSAAGAERTAAARPEMDFPGILVEVLP